MANNSVENASKNTTSLLLVDINLPIALEWELFVINENKVSSFSLDRLESKFLVETNTDETKDVNSRFQQLAAVTYKTRFEKQQVPTFKSNEDSWVKSLDNLKAFPIEKLNTID